MPGVEVDPVLSDLASGFEALGTKVDNLVSKNNDLRRQLRNYRRDVSTNFLEAIHPICMMKHNSSRSRATLLF